MSGEIKNIVLINGSPKPPADVSVSGTLSSLLEGRLKEGADITNINARKSAGKKSEQEYRAIMNADAVIFIFPLYFFCLPGVLIRYLQDFYEYFKQHESEAKGGAKVYAVVNCGFPETDINSEALRVIESFSTHIGASYRFGISIGGGGMYLSAKNAPVMKKPVEKLSNAFGDIAADITDGVAPHDTIYIELKFPRALYFLGGNVGWSHAARKNSLKKKDLYRKPY
jgi:hypothetical protein